MTMAELEKRVKALESELRMLRHEIQKHKGAAVMSGFGQVGTFKDDPTFLEAVRLGKEYRDKVNRESLREFDREQKRQRAKGKAKKSNARP